MAEEMVLVDTTAYGVPGAHWCEVVGVSEGDAAVYPIKVQVPGKGVGQYKQSEVAETGLPISIMRCTMGTSRRNGCLGG